MLNLDMQKGSIIHVGDDIRIKFRSYDPETGRLSLGFEAPRHIIIDRESVHQRRVESVKHIGAPAFTRCEECKAPLGGNAFCKYC